MRKYILIVTMVILCSSCNRVYYWFSPSRSFSERFQTIPFDDSYTLYIRTICRMSDPHKNFELCNCQDPAFQNIKKGKTEIEYLFLSKKWSRAVYITTIPDKKVHHYNNDTHTNDDSVVFSDLNRIHIGNYNVQNNRLEFQEISNLTTIFWYVSDVNDFLKVDSVVDYNSSIAHYNSLRKESKNEKKKTSTNPDLTLSTGMHFYPHTNYYIVMDSACECQKNIVGLKENYLYVIPVKKGFEVMFHMNGTWADNPSSDYVYFTKKRIVSLPPLPIR